MFQVRKYASIQKGILIISLQLWSGFYEFSWSRCLRILQKSL